MPRDTNFPVSRDNYRRKRDPFAQHGINFAFGPYLSVSRVCIGDHYASSRSRFVTRTFRANTSQQVSLGRRPEMECMRKRHSDRSYQIHSPILLQNRQSNAVRSFQDQISWKMSESHHTCFSRWSHHVHDRSAVRDGVGQ